MRIGLISDTHGWIHPSLNNLFAECDEIWHAGDIGGQRVADKLSDFKPLRAVYGNIDDSGMRRRFKEQLRFETVGIKVFMTHIGGYPGRYAPGIRKSLYQYSPDLFISGHSHIAKVVPDNSLGLLHINPGAAGYNGLHHIMTAVRFSIIDGKITNLEMIELGERGKVES